MQKLLLGYKLKDLGTMTAHLDFPLVSWLRRERNRAASIDDFVSALRHIHLDFSWPYPSVPATQIRRYSLSSLNSLPSPDESMTTAEEGIHRLSIAVPKVFNCI